MVRSAVIRGSSGATILSIAEAAEVSPATVSRVLNRTATAHFTKETAARVLEAAEKLGYRTNETARALRMKRTNRLQVLAPAWRDLFRSEYQTGIFHGIAEAAQAAGYGLMLSLIPQESWSEAGGAAEAISSGSADGTICAPAALPFPLPRSNRLVLAGWRPAEPYASWVDCNNVEGARMAVEHLVRAGRKRIVHLEGHPLSTSARERKEGFRAAMRKLRLTPRVHPCGYDLEDGERAARKVLDAKKPFDALFCANDLAALGALRTFAVAGVRVPDDVAIVGFDGLPTAQILSPRLASIRQPLAEIGRESVRILLGAIEGRSRNPIHRVLDVEFIPGETI